MEPRRVASMPKSPEPPKLGRAMQALIRRISARAKPEPDYVARERIIAAARWYPISVEHRYDRQGLRVYCCPNPTEWQFWIDNTYAWLQRDFPRITALGVEQQVRDILLQRLKDMERQDGGTASSSGIQIKPRASSQRRLVP